MSKQFWIVALMLLIFCWSMVVWSHGYTEGLTTNPNKPNNYKCGITKTT